MDILASMHALGHEQVLLSHDPSCGYFGIIAIHDTTLGPALGGTRFWQYASTDEAIFCVMEGVATPEAIDTVMKLGMAHPMGPLALADFIGLDVCLAILEVLHSELGDPKYRPCPLLRRMVDAGWLGRKSGRGFYTYS